MTAIKLAEGVTLYNDNGGFAIQLGVGNFLGSAPLSQDDMRIMAAKLLLAANPNGPSINDYIAMILAVNEVDPNLRIRGQTPFEFLQAAVLGAFEEIENAEP